MLVVIGVRADGKKMLLAIKSLGGERAEAWRTGSMTSSSAASDSPEFLMVDGATGLEKAIATIWDGVPVQRRTVHKHRNPLAHAPERLHEEITADYNDMIYAATRQEIETRRKAFIRKRRLKHRAICRSPDCGQPFQETAQPPMRPPSDAWRADCMRRCPPSHSGKSESAPTLVSPSVEVWPGCLLHWNNASPNVMTAACAAVSLSSQASRYHVEAPRRCGKK
jgi:Transposase, Mutator family